MLQLIERWVIKPTFPYFAITSVIFDELVEKDGFIFDSVFKSFYMGICSSKLLEDLGRLVIEDITGLKLIDKTKCLLFLLKKLHN